MVINICFGRNFSADHDHASLGDGFAGNLGIWVLGEVSVEDGIGDAIADLVRMAFANRLRSKQKPEKNEA